MFPYPMSDIISFKTIIMKTFKNFIFLFAFSLVVFSCSKEVVDEPNVLTEAQISPRSTLAHILANGVSEADDFDVLRSNSEYPFAEISQSDFDDYTDSLRFESSKLQGGNFALSTKLTINQFKIWYQKALHANIDLDYNTGFSSSVFRSDIENETQYSDISGYSDQTVSIGYEGWADLPEDCPAGFGECTSGF